ncbi:ASCH domain-containing protein [Carnobacterium funditum]|uniref:ASCH domain-containing protein n=1 Tax=Carnobacterium funditum TaxID=2752 RepID=UPI00054DCA73|nr:ASCH domain-containing protein [Carnobacterium funditum]
MNEKQLWEKFIKKQPEYEKEKYVAWQYGVVPDELADLTMREIKTATSSAYDLYLLEGEALPKTGEWNIILDSKDQAICITRTTNVSIVPYDEVTSEHAFKEGEGDRSLAYWRTVHKDFYSKEYKENNLEFNETIPVVCEEFELMYK